MQRDQRKPYALIVEDHPLVADSLVACIRACNSGLRVEIAESLGVALEVLARRPKPSLIITDLTLTDARGLEAARRLRQAAPDAPLLVFTAVEDPALREEAKALGAIGYLIKSASIQMLRDQIAAVIGSSPGAVYAAPTAAVILSRMTPKQIAVLDELVAGRSNKEIAARMSISDETVGSHLKEIFARLGVRNRTEAVVSYLQSMGQGNAGRRG